jgi:hypothetical protein
MALRNQPYIPLYVQDFLTDEKLIECSAESTGVYIRLICILHKSEEYGKVLLKQKDKQCENQVKNFASKLIKQMPYTMKVIESSLDELINEGVIQIEGDFLIQKRMVKDNDISVKRSESGKKGGENTQFASKFALSKIKANTEYEYEDEIKDTNKDKKNKNDYSEEFNKFWTAYPKKSGSKKSAFDNWNKLNGHRPEITIILSAIKSQLSWRKNSNGEFRPDWKDPERWIKGKMWEVELTSLNKPSIKIASFTNCSSCGHPRLLSDLDENGICLGRCDNATASV